MSIVNGANERIKRTYARYLIEACGLAAVTIDHNLRAIADFEKFVSHRNFKTFSDKDAVAYKRCLLNNGGKRAAELSSRATVLSKLRSLQQFFRWLADQPGYKSRISHQDVEYFRPSERDIRLTRGRREKHGPTLEQARKVILNMPAETAIEQRNRAVVALALLTGARVMALASFQLKHARADRCGIDQDAHQVKTKNSKTFTTFFFPVGADIKQIFLDYVDFLRNDLAWGKDDPLFPRTRQELGADHQFHVVGLEPIHWQTAEPIRDIFRHAFAAAGIPYFSPHTFRNTIVNLGEARCRTFEEMKAWSQNLGHEEISTTLASYGHVRTNRQFEVIAAMCAEQVAQIQKETDPAPDILALSHLMDQLNQQFSVLSLKQRQKGISTPTGEPE